MTSPLLNSDNNKNNKRRDSHHRESPEYGRPRASSTPKIPKRTLPLDSSSPKPSHRHTPRGQHHAGDEIDIQLNDTTDTADLTSSKMQQMCTPKIQSSFVLCCGFLCFGSSMAIIGPTVLELGCLTGQDVGAMSWVFFAQTFSALLGAIFSGIITDRFSINYNIFLSVVMVVHGIALSILPFMRTLSSLIFVTSIHGLFAGFQDTATNLRMIIMHGQDVPPYLQTLFFFYGVGAFLSPIIAGNFLNSECNNNQMEGLGDDLDVFARKRNIFPGTGSTSPNTAAVSLWIKGIGTHLAANTSESTNPTTKIISSDNNTITIASTRIHWAYFVIALLHLVVTFGLIYLYFAEKKRREELNMSLGMSQSGSTMDETASKSERSEIDPNIRTQVLFISFWIALMVFISDGLQGSFGSYIYTYAIKSGIGINTDNAAYLNSLFWGALALGRLFAIFVSIYVSPRVMLLADVAGCLASIILMFLFRHQVTSLWIGTATFGLCLSNIFPTSVSMAESYFRLTGTITCFFVVCSGIGEMAIPLLIGKLFDVIGPISFLAISCILCFTSVGIYIAVVITGKGISQRLKDIQRSTPDLIEEYTQTESDRSNAESNKVDNGIAHNDKDVTDTTKNIKPSESGKRK